MSAMQVRGGRVVQDGDLHFPKETHIRRKTARRAARQQWPRRKGSLFHLSQAIFGDFLFFLSSFSALHSVM
jgi:hypothetical protein